MVVVRLEHSAPHNCPLHRTPPQYMPTSLQQPAPPSPLAPQLTTPRIAVFGTGGTDARHAGCPDRTSRPESKAVATEMMK